MLVSIVLGLLPLLGVAWIILAESLFTVDGLFTALILLTMSGIFFLNAALEVKQHGLGAFRPRRTGATTTSAASGSTATAASDGSPRVEVGLVESVQYFEAAIGQPNKSLVVLRPEGAAPRTLVFCGNVGHQLTVGRRVEISYRPREQGCYDLLSRNYV